MVLNSSKESGEAEGNLRERELIKGWGQDSAQFLIAMHGLLRRATKAKGPDHASEKWVDFQSILAFVWTFLDWNPGGSTRCCGRRMSW
jgi:hypothetical protein